MQDDIIEVLEEEIIVQNADILDVDQVQQNGSNNMPTARNEMNRKEDTSKEEVNKCQDTSANARVAQRRAQFAASGGDSSSGSVPRPRKKCTRMQFY